MTSRSVFAVAATIALMLGVVLAQPRTNLTGIIVDETNAPIPGVEIRATLESNPVESRTATSDDEGHFRFDDLPAGVYRIDYFRPGFGRSVRRGVEVVVGQSQVLTLQLRSIVMTTPPDLPPTRGGRGQTSQPPPGSATVPVFFATDRARTEPSDVLNYGSGRNPGGSLHLGRFDVRIPRDHQMGAVERPNIWTLWREDPNKHLTITRRTQLSYEEFYRDVRQVVGKAARKEAFVFVHGFNVTFESAIFRTAQISYDIGFDGAPILYSWPSAESLTPIGYSTDAENNNWTVPHLRWFLEDVAARSGAERVHLIAHSMGNKALVNALDRMAPSSTKKFAQIVLTAPDIDADTFVQLADAVRRNGQMATLYASANDKALLASKKLQTYRRAGDTTAGVLVVPGIDTVDVSAVDTDLVGHFYYGANTSVVSDIFLLLTQGLPPAKRPRLRSEGAPPHQFWRFAP